MNPFTGVPRLCLLALCAIWLPYVAKAQGGLTDNRRMAADTAARTPQPLSLILLSAQPAPARTLLSPAGATTHYGFFCRQELKWDKALPVPVRFRVGSHEACDRLEGKIR